MHKKTTHTLMFIVFAMVSITTCCHAQLLTIDQATTIIRQWLGKPNWQPTFSQEDSYQCSCGTMRPVFSMRNSTDVIHIDRQSHNIIDWSSGFDANDNNDDPQVLEAAFNAWAPSHLPSAFLAKMVRLTPHLWTYRQTNGIRHLTTGICITVNLQGQVNSADIYDCELPDYTGNIPVTSAQAMQIAGNWASTMYSGATVELTWPQQSNLPYYGYENYNPTVYYVIFCKLVSDSGMSSEPIITVNALTGEVYDDASKIGSLTNWRPRKSNLLVVTYDKKTITGYPNSLISLKSLQALAKGRKLSAKAGEKAFTLDGKRIALPAKVAAKAGTLYLPWQALKSLPGIKCSYDAKLNRLDITTAKATAKTKTAASPK